MPRNLVPAVFGGLCLLIFGCGGGASDKPELGQVSGKVTMDGDPLPNVNVTFNAEKGQPATGKTNESGEYTLSYLGEPGVPAGKNVVSINTPAPDGGDGGCGCGDEEFLDPIPLRYNAQSRDNPDMIKEVKAGKDHEFNFDLTSDGPKAQGGGCGNFDSNPCCSEF